MLFTAPHNEATSLSIKKMFNQPLQSEENVLIAFIDSSVTPYIFPRVRLPLLKEEKVVVYFLTNDRSFTYYTF